MLGLEFGGGAVRAATTVGLVLGESMVLYFGYGALDSTLGETVIDALEGE